MEEISAVFGCQSVCIALHVDRPAPINLLLSAVNLLLSSVISALLDSPCPINGNFVAMMASPDVFWNVPFRGLSV